LADKGEIQDRTTPDAFCKCFGGGIRDFVLFSKYKILFNGSFWAEKSLTEYWWLVSMSKPARSAADTARRIDHACSVLHSSLEDLILSLFSSTLCNAAPVEPFTDHGTENGLLGGTHIC